MNKDKGWIKINRKMLEWEHFKERDTFHVFMTLMLLAYPKAKTVDGKTTEAGQVRTSIAQIMELTGITSNHKVIDALKTLTASGEIKKERVGNESVITICNFGLYQGCANMAQPDDQGCANMAQQVVQIQHNKLCKYSTTPIGINIVNIERNLKNNKEADAIKAREEKIEPQKPQKIGFEKYGPDGLVELRPAEYRTLAEQYGEDQLKDAIKDLNDNIADGSTESTSHYHTLRKWLNYRKKNDKPQKTWKVDLNALKI